MTGGDGVIVEEEIENVAGVVVVVVAVTVEVEAEVVILVVSVDPVDLVVGVLFPVLPASYQIAATVVGLTGVTVLLLAGVEAGAEVEVEAEALKLIEIARVATTTKMNQKIRKMKKKEIKKNEEIVAVVLLVVSEIEINEDLRVRDHHTLDQFIAADLVDLVDLVPDHDHVLTLVLHSNHHHLLLLPLLLPPLLLLTLDQMLQSPKTDVQSLSPN